MNRLNVFQQKARFQTGLEKILAYNAFYQDKLKQARIESAGQIQNWEDYRRLPFTTKEELTADQTDYPPYGTNLTFPVSHYTRIHQTSGTTALRYDGWTIQIAGTGGVNAGQTSMPLPE